MNRRKAIAILAGASTGCSRFRHGNPSTYFAAFSLAAAEKALKASRGPLAPIIESLGGITRIVGGVCDQGRGFVAVGRVEPNVPPILLADLVSALRGVQTGWPLVSIDRTADTASSGHQAIRLENIARDSALALKMVSADIRLKRAALFGESLPIPSLFELCAAASRRGEAPPDVSSRLWFYAREPSLLFRDDVVAIRRLSVGVQTQVVGGSSRDALSDDFAASFEKQFPFIADHFPEIRQVPGLFDLVAIAKGAEAVGANVAFWLRDYEVPAVEVPRTYPVLRRQERFPKGGDHVLELEGGIDMRVLSTELRDGDHTAFRLAVLRSRPEGAMVWRVPLEGWRTNGISVAEQPGSAGPPLGMQVQRRVIEAAPSPAGGPGFHERGGVTVDVPIAPDEFRRKQQ